VTCAACGQGDHRYGTTDPDHEPDRMACINGLRHENDQLREILSAVLGPGLTAEEFRARYLAGEADARCMFTITGIGSQRLVCSRADGHKGPHSDGVASWTPVSPSGVEVEEA
jgi:hypothetical protein